jgi:hypothetical protein
MGGLRRKRALLRKVTSFNLYADQWAQIQAIMEATRAQKDAPVLRELIDEALAARRRKFVRQEQEEQTATLTLEAETLEPIRLVLIKMLRQFKTCLRADGINLRLLQEAIAEIRADRKCIWEALIVPKLHGEGKYLQDISNLFEEDTVRAKDFAYRLAEEIRNAVLENEKRSSDANVSQEAEVAG